MTEIDRDIALALLKRLRERALITEEQHQCALHSRFFDQKRFTPYPAQSEQE